MLYIVTRINVRLYTGFMGPEDYNRLPVSRSRGLQARCNAAAATVHRDCVLAYIIYVFYWSPGADGPGVRACAPA